MGTINESFGSIFKNCTREELEELTANLKTILKKYKKLCPQNFEDVIFLV